jgi:hypoxanthine phosphoribosyltransferase
MLDVLKLTADARRASLAGTRMLIVDECFDAITDLLIASKAVSAREAEAMLGSLASRLADHANGKTDTDYIVHRKEMDEQVLRLKSRAAQIGLQS